MSNEPTRRGAKNVRIRPVFLATTRIDNMFCVDIKRDCPHVAVESNAELFLASRAVIEANRCCAKDCPSTVENWLCTQCFKLSCGRHVNSHALAHARSSKHHVAVGLADLSVWCYKCESYVSGCEQLLSALHEMKFGCVQPTAIVHTDEEQLLINRNKPTKRKADTNNDDNDEADESVRAIDPTELLDTPAQMAQAALDVAAMIRNATRVVWFTGAGISTSASIPDYRSPNGLWTLRDRGEQPTLGIKLELAEPTLTHRFIAARARASLDSVVSQNVDGLHLRSGVPEAQLAELHGNAFRERCVQCGTVYARTFDVVGRRGLVAPIDRAHATGRTCTACAGGVLCDTIVSFGEQLPEAELNFAMRVSRASDLFVVLGSSLRVTPAADLPRLALDNAARLVIVNKQPTPLDASAHVLVHADIDTFIAAVQANLA